MIRIILVLVIAFLFAFPSLADTEADFSHAYKSYSGLADEGKFKEAVPFAKRALELGEQIYGSDHETVAILTLNLGFALSRTKQYDESYETLLLANDRYEKVHGKRSVELLLSLEVSGDAMAGREADRAAKFFRQATNLAEEVYGKDEPQVAMLLLKRADASMSLDDADSARKFLARARRMLAKAGEDYAYQYGLALFDSGRLRMGLSKYQGAEEYFLSALEQFEGHAPRNDKMILSAHAFLVQIYERQGKREKATPYVHYLTTLELEGNADVEPIFRVVPSYPMSAARTGREGHVDMRFRVDEAGFVHDVEITESQPKKVFDKAAIECVEKWRYKPRVADGEFVSREGVEVRITFELEN